MTPAPFAPLFERTAIDYRGDGQQPTGRAYAAMRPGELPTLWVDHGRSDTVVGYRWADGQMREVHSLLTAHYPGALAAGDFDGDGFGDLVVLNSGSHEVSVYWGNASGLDAAQSFGAGREPLSMLVVDLDRDGQVDLVVGSVAERSVSVLYGLKGRAFAAPRRIATADAAWGLWAADLDGDGHLDMAWVGYRDNGFHSALSSENRQWNEHTDSTLGPKAGDLAVLPGSSKTASFAALVEAGDEVVTFDVDRNTRQIIRKTPYQLSKYSRHIRVADVNGDGKPDLLASVGFQTAGKTDGVYVLYGLEAGRFTEPHRISVESTDDVAVADFDGDGKNEIIAVTYAGLWIARTQAVSETNAQHSGSALPDRPGLRLVQK